MSRKLFIAGNWKMNHGIAATTAMLSELKPKVADLRDIDIAVCPPFTSLGAAADACEGTNIAVGAQNVHWAEDGAYTGEAAAAMLKEIPVLYAIIGHSERRQYFAETDVTVNLRLRACLQAGLLPIVCVGESLDQREADQTAGVVKGQIETSLASLSAADMAKTTIAYEPVWAIGTGRTATPDQAQEVHKIIRDQLRSLFGDVAEQVRIQYGGSVKPANVKELMSQPDIDGALVGGASLKADVFSELLHNAQ